MKHAVRIIAVVLGLCVLGCAARQKSTMEPAERRGETYGTTPSSASTSVPSAPSTMMPGPSGLLAPSAIGTITTSVDDNKNTLVTLEVEHLPPPTNLDPSLTTYVVWIRPRAGGDVLNVGQLEMTPDRTGELQAATPHANFDVLLTAESSATVRQPSRFVVLQGQGSRP